MILAQCCESHEDSRLTEVDCIVAVLLRMSNLFAWFSFLFFFFSSPCLMRIKRLTHIAGFIHRISQASSAAWQNLLQATLALRL